MIMDWLHHEVPNNKYGMCNHWSTVISAIVNCYMSGWDAV